MAEETVKDIPETVPETESCPSPAQDMEVEAPTAAEQQPNGDAAENGDAKSKRERDDGAEPDEEESGGSKKPRTEKSVEEQRLEKLEGGEAAEGNEESVRVSVGPKSFGSSVEMFDYFYKFLHYWTPKVNVNKYEHLVLLDLLKKGHLEADRKIGDGIRAFQVQYHPEFKSRCFFLVRNDGTVDDFSFRKCVDHILPLPEHMQIKHDVNKALGGGGYRGGKGGGGGGRGGRGHGHGGRGRGRGGKSRN